LTPRWQRAAPIEAPHFRSGLRVVSVQASVYKGVPQPTRPAQVIYGGGGLDRRGVARAFAREGARVFLAGRTGAKLEAVAAEIHSAGGAAETAEVDALDEGAVDEHADAVAAAAGGIDAAAP
jgi:shikimate 5-dehydrogenase